MEKDSNQELRVEIPDLVYGRILLEGPVAQLMETAEIARLKHIKQLATLDLFFPTANHTRYAHSCGVAHLTNEFFKQLRLKSLEALSMKDRLRTTQAAFLHDIGQPAWSHAGELFCKYRGYQLEHEKISAELITNGEKFDKYLNHWNRPRIADVIQDESERVLISKIILGNPPVDESIPQKDDIKKMKRYLGQVVNSYCDLDRVEYLIRDSVGLGSHAPFREGLIFSNLDIITSKTGEKLLGFVNPAFAQYFVLTREFNYSIFYRDQRDILAREMLARAWNKVFISETDPYTFWFCTDDELLVKIRDSKDPLAIRVADMIQSRKLYDVAYAIPFSQLPTEVIDKFSKLDLDRPALLRFEAEICKEMKVECDQLIIGIYIYREPKELSANVLNHEKEIHRLEEYPLMKPLRDIQYKHERSGLVVGTWNIDDSLKEKIYKRILEKQIE